MNSGLDMHTNYVFIQRETLHNQLFILVHVDNVSEKDIVDFWAMFVWTQDGLLDSSDYICRWEKRGRESWGIELGHGHPISFIRKPILFLKLISRGPSSESTCYQAWCPESDPWNSHDERRKPTLTSCLMTSTCMTWHVYTHIHINMLHTQLYKQ